MVVKVHRVDVWDNETTELPSEITEASMIKILMNDLCLIIVYDTELKR